MRSQITVDGTIYDVRGIGANVNGFVRTRLSRPGQSTIVIEPQIPVSWLLSNDRSSVRTSGHTFSFVQV